MLNSFFLDKEEIISNEFKNNGFIIKKINQTNSYEWINKKALSISKKILKNKDLPDNFLDNSHKYIEIKNLNNFRVNIINDLNELKEFQYHYHNLSREFLDLIVGNELAMQKRVNLSIQIPNDSSSLLPVHSDVWSGDSPYEVVVWLPLVNCYKTKSMFILPPKKNEKLNKKFNKFHGKSSESLFNAIKNDVKWLKVNRGEVLIFNQSLPHGNRINKEKETRWSMNCRFKSLFSPYGDKKIGEFFVPITTRAATTIGMQYLNPSLKK